MKGIHGRKRKTTKPKIEIGNTYGPELTIEKSNSLRMAKQQGLVRDEAIIKLLQDYGRSKF